MDSEKFTGIWIPKAIWKDKCLSFMQRCLLAEIYHLQDDEKNGWAWASNKYLAELFCVSERWIKENISVLVEMKYVKSVVTGKKRIMRVLRYGGTNVPSDGGTIVHPKGEQSFTIDNSERIDEKELALRAAHKRVVSEYYRMFKEKSGKVATIDGRVGSDIKTLLSLKPEDEILACLGRYFQNGFFFNKSGYSFSNFKSHYDEILSSIPRKQGDDEDNYVCPHCGLRPQGHKSGVPFCFTCNAQCREAEPAEGD